MVFAFRRAGVLVLLAAFTLIPALAFAQQSNSEKLAAELVSLLDTRKLDSAAAAGPSDGEYAGALYFQGSQLLVVGAAYSSPARMSLLIGARQYRDAYIDLNSASDPESKLFISDLGADGLHFDRKGNNPYDTIDVGGRSYAFDGDWGKAKISKDEYTKAFLAADERYSRMLEVLIAELKKAS